MNKILQKGHKQWLLLKFSVFFLYHFNVLLLFYYCLLFYGRDTRFAFTTLIWIFHVDFSSNPHTKIMSHDIYQRQTKWNEIWKRKMSQQHTANALEENFDLLSRATCLLSTYLLSLCFETKVESKTATIFKKDNFWWWVRKSSLFVCYWRRDETLYK